MIPWQIEIAGVMLGPGTDIPVGDMDGLASAPVRSQDVDIPHGDGAFAGSDLYEARPITIEAGIRTPGSPQAALDILARLQSAADDPRVRTVPGAHTVLRIALPGRPAKRLHGRLREVQPASLKDLVHGWIPISITFTAHDPRFHADTENSLHLPLSAAGLGGLRAPIVAPVTTGVAIPDERRGWVHNDGNRAAWPSLRITGPCSNPRIRHVETGKPIELAATIGRGEYVDIETRPGTRWVLLNGTGSLATALSPASRLDDFILPAGTSEVWWTARDHTADTRLSITWRSAYSAL